MVGQTGSQHFCVPRLIHLDCCSPLLSFPVDVLAPFWVLVSLLFGLRGREIYLEGSFFPLWQAVWCTETTIPRWKLVLFFLSASLWWSFFLKGLPRWVLWGISICWYRYCIILSDNYLWFKTLSVFSPRWLTLQSDVWQPAKRNVQR